MSAVIIAILIVAFVSLLQKEDKAISVIREQKSVSSYSELVYNPLFCDDNLAESKLSMQENGLDYVNYWVMSSVGITLCSVMILRIWRN